MAVCTSVTLVKEIDADTDIVKVTIDNDVTAYMVYDYSKCAEFVNQEVIVSYRKDIYEGKIEVFINTLTIPVKVITLSRESGVKLYAHQEDNGSNCCLVDIQEGQSMGGAILYCVETMFESSLQAVWMTLVVRDRSGRTAKLRLFDYDRTMDYSGSYIKANIRRTKYGFNTDMIEPMSIEYAPNPEIEICKQYIREYFANDEFMEKILGTSKLLERLEEYVELEVGYALVRLAIELDILNELKNVFDSVDFMALAYALILRYGFVTNPKLDVYSEKLRAIVFAMRQKMPQTIATKVLQILDEGRIEGKRIPEKAVFEHILELADSVIKAKKVVE